MKKQEVGERIEFLDFHINRLESEIRKLKLSKYELQKKFGIKDVVASVLCVDKQGCSGIKIGYRYKLIDENCLDYTILNGYGDRCRYPKNCFEIS